MDGLEMCARDLSHALQECQRLEAENEKLKKMLGNCQRLEAENEKLKKMLRSCKTPIKDYYRRHDGKWDLTDHYYHGYDAYRLKKYKKLYDEINSVLGK